MSDRPPTGGAGGVGEPDDDPGEQVGPFPLVSKRRRRPDEGDLEVFVANEQSVHEVDTARWARLAEQVLGAEGISGAAELSVLFVDSTTIADLNARFMGNEGPTDVLAFPLEDELIVAGRWPDSGTSGPAATRSEPTDMPLLLGDVVICPEVAARNAPDHAGTYDDELALLLVHGILHVLGMDHADEAETAVMQAREQALLGQFHRPAV